MVWVLNTGRAYLRVVLSALLLLLAPALQMMVPIQAQAATMSLACSDINDIPLETQGYDLLFAPLKAGEVVSWSANLPSSGGYFVINIDYVRGSYITLFNLGGGPGSGPVSGTFTANSYDGFYVSVASFSDPVQITLSCAAAPDPYEILPASGNALMGGTQYQAYSGETIATSGGSGSSSYSVTSGSLPQGLSLSEATGEISGTPLLAGTYNFDVTATDDADGSKTATGSYSIEIDAAEPYAISPVSGSTLTAGQHWVAYSGATISATGGVGTSSFAVTTGVLPSGLSLDSATGAISGTPLVHGSFDFEITASDDGVSGRTVRASYTIVIDAATPYVLSPANGSGLSGGTFGVAYPGVSVSTTGGSGTNSFAVTYSSLPAGLTLDTATGAISGTPTAFGSFNFDITATDGGVGGSGRTSVANYTIAIGAASSYEIVPVSGTALTGGKIDTAYAGVTLSTTGGVGASGFSLASGALPAGLTLNAQSGAISGTPTAIGTFSFSVSAMDGGSSRTSIANYTITIVPAAEYEIHPANGKALAKGTVGVAYAGATISASGGTGTTSFSLTQGTLPNGLSLDVSSGAISGTPTASGAFGFAVTAIDSGSAKTAVASYSIAVIAQATFSPAAGALPKGMVDEPFNLTVGAPDAPAGVTFSVSGGALPEGLSLDPATGVISGMPTSAGHFTFTISLGGTAAGSATYSLDIAERAVTAANKTAVIVPGAPIPPISLTDFATGGPFLSAELISVVPPQAGVAVITTMSGTSSRSKAAAPDFYLTFKPNPNFAGTSTVTYTLTSALGVSNEATVTFFAELDSAAVKETFTTMGEGFVTQRQSMISTFVRLPGLIERRSGPSAGGPVSADLGGGGDSMTLAVSTSLAQINAAGASAADGLALAAEPMPFNIWIDGALALHQDDESEEWGRFSLISVGADYLVNDRLLVGVALIGDWAEDPALGGTTQGNGFMIGPYVSSEIADGILLDVSALFGQSWNSTENSGFSGEFGTQRLLLKAKLEGQWVQEALTLRPNINFVLNQETVEGYVVTNADGDSVAIDGFEAAQIRFGVGGSAAYAIDLDNGTVLTPGLTAGIGSMGDWDSLFANAYGTLGGSLTLSGLNWSLNGALTLDVDTTGAKAVSARGGLGVKF